MCDTWSVLPPRTLTFVGTAPRREQVHPPACAKGRRFEMKKTQSAAPGIIVPLALERSLLQDVEYTSEIQHATAPYRRARGLGFMADACVASQSPSHVQDDDRQPIAVRLAKIPRVSANQ